jgi:hypothetical protein
MTSSVAYGTNGSQQVGYGPVVESESNYHAILWSGTAASAVDLNPSGYDRSIAFGISGSQQVGFARVSGTLEEGHAMLWSGTAASAVDLNSSGFRFSFAYGVGGSQQVGYGNGAATGNDNHAILWGGTAASAVDLNPIGIDSSIAFGTNGSQQVGYGWGSVTGGRAHAILWSGSATSALDLHQFLPSGFRGSYARGVDPFGNVVGYAFDGSRTAHAILWQFVPEPGTLVMLGGGVLFVLVYASRRRRRWSCQLSLSEVFAMSIPYPGLFTRSLMLAWK